LQDGSRKAMKAPPPRKPDKYPPARVLLALLAWMVGLMHFAPELNADWLKYVALVAVALCLPTTLQRAWHSVLQVRSANCRIVKATCKILPFFFFSIGWLYPLLRLRSTTNCRRSRLCMFHNV
jgi:hypothetical protein